MGRTSNNTYAIYSSAYYGLKRVKKPCAKCGLPFKDGELVFKKRTKVIKPYHKKCWESTLI